MKGDISNAIEKLEKLQEVAPNYRESKAMLDELKIMNMGSDNPSLRTQPKLGDDMQTQALEQRSFQYYNEKNYVESIRVLEKLVELAPHKKSGYLNNIGVCYEEMEDNDKAMIFYKKALSADETNLTAYGGMASIYLKQGNRSEAIKYYEKILEKSPEDQTVKTKVDSLRALK
jgi:tetratricopeptide (TPR) repeat protein